MLVSVIIATCNRPDTIRATIEAVLNCDYEPFELLVVDQSTTPTTKQIAESIHDPRLRYLTAPQEGKPTALNVGIAASQGDLIAFTDDDCLPVSNWLDVIVAAFADRPQAGLLFGPVVPVEHDPEQGFVPTFEAGDKGHNRRYRLKFGIGASMAARRRVLLELNGFDKLLGPGAPLGPTDDEDIAYRTGKAGYEVWYEPQAVVIHDGFRNWKDGQRLVKAYAEGMGATYTKYLRCGDPEALLRLTILYVVYLFNSLKRLVLWQRPFGLAWLVYTTGGVWKSLHYPVDRKRCQYRAMPDDRPGLLEMTGRPVSEPTKQRL